MDPQHSQWKCASFLLTWNSERRWTFYFALREVYTNAANISECNYLSYTGIWMFSSSIKRLMTSSHLPFIFSTARSSFGVHWNKRTTTSSARVKWLQQHYMLNLIQSHLHFIKNKYQNYVPEGWQYRVLVFCLLVCSCTTDKRISSAPRGRHWTRHTGDATSN